MVHPPTLDSPPHVMVYVHKHLLKLRPALWQDLINYHNVMILSLFSRGELLNLMNVYLDDMHTAINLLARDVDVFPTFIYICGDFNCHSSVWVPSMDHHHTFAISLLKTASDLGVEWARPINASNTHIPHNVELKGSGHVQCSDSHSSIAEEDASTAITCLAKAAIIIVDNLEFDGTPLSLHSLSSCRLIVFGDVMYDLGCKCGLPESGPKATHVIHEATHGSADSAGPCDINMGSPKAPTLLPPDRRPALAGPSLLPKPAPAKARASGKAPTQAPPTPKVRSDGQARQAPIPPSVAKKSFAEVACTPASVATLIKLAQSHPTLEPDCIAAMHQATLTDAPSVKKPHMTTLGPTRCLLFLEFTGNSSDITYLYHKAMCLLNNSLTCAKSLLRIKNITRAYDTISLYTNSVATDADALVIESSLSSAFTAPFELRTKRPRSRSYLKILDVPYYMSGIRTTLEHITDHMHLSPFKEIFGNVSSVRIMRNSAKADTATVWVNLWDSQSGANAKRLVGKYLNFNSIQSMIKAACAHPRTPQYQ
ncbi:hypothetical protein D9756_004290 [Leucocoprinus leucothites]|uniref:Endonuclease/exonuclease/phosphatase domain-containing protein n=1 Tax=Leucocoprinus leucothites TaxID=201217 RepID=A0A8H5DAP2_9AGAR|nr:hypothetical protein D9756_004290 [Leucoagaricus leucothites]